MPRSLADRSEKVEVIPATLEQQPVLDNLLQFYAHDFMDFYDLELDVDGRFRYLNLPLYWSEPERHPFLIRIDGRLAGFVLVKKGSDVSGNSSAWDMAEFFILRGVRRRGAGTQAAHKVWKLFPGRWEVRVLKANRSALGFWRHAISSFAGKRISPSTVKHESESWNLFSFESKPTA
jgi:predicted acetyltransferase